MAQLGGGKPLSLLEIGTSAGLNLRFDRYAYETAEGVRGWPQSPVKLAVDSRGDLAVLIPVQMPAVDQRIGIDLRPIPADDAEGVLWLEALIWPEHRERLADLRTALAVAAEAPCQLVAGDAVELTGPILRRLPADTTVCVFQTHTFNQISPAGREAIQEAMRTAGREVFYVSRSGELTLTRYRPGMSPETERLAETDPHGRWVRWMRG